MMWTLGRSALWLAAGVGSGGLDARCRPTTDIASTAGAGSRILQTGHTVAEPGAPPPPSSAVIMCADANRGIQREATVLPGEHLADVITLDQPAAGKPAQYPDAHLFVDGGDSLRCHFSGGAKAPRHPRPVRRQSRPELLIPTRIGGGVPPPRATRPKTRSAKT